MRRILTELLASFFEPFLAQYTGRRSESLEHIQGVPNSRHESFFERGYEDAIGDPVGGIGG